jgi:CubicO group peptidase (beta-lactamase class C family)
MTSPRSNINAAFAIGFVILLVIVARIAISLAPAAPIYRDAASVPSVTAVTGNTQFSGAVAVSRDLARALMVRANLPGLSVAAAVQGQIVWAEGFGRADVPGRVPLTPLTRFRLGALSKPLTAW